MMSEFPSRNHPLISIIVPVYNVEPYLRRCLDSIQEQTYPNLEIILVVSDSSDDSVRICEEYGIEDSRIILIRSEPKGLSDARNKGIDAAHGEFLSFIDSDDYIHPDFISTLYDVCANHDCDVAQGGCMQVQENDIEIHPDDPKDIHVYSGREMCFNLCKGIPDATVSIVTWSKLYRRELFAALRFPVGKIHEDEATTHQVFYSAENVGVTTQILYFYRQVSTGIMGSDFSLKRLDGLEFMDERVHFFEAHGEHELQALARSRYARAISRYLLQLKKHCSGTEDIQKDLRMKCRSVLRDVLKDSYLSVTEKGITVLCCTFPRVADMIRRNVHRKNIVA